MNKPYDIDYLLEEVVALPSLPRSVQYIIQLTSDPNCALAVVAKAISADPSLALKTLRLVNSAYYGLGKRIATIEHAVVLLGLKVINNLVITASVFEAVKATTGTFLRHSVSSAIAMRILSEYSGKRIGVDSGEEAFVYGLLHDVGKVVLEQFVPQEYQAIDAVARERRIPWFEAEREIIGVDHAMVGARLAEKWKLPERIVDVILGHHDLAMCKEAESRPTAATLSIADYIATACAMPSNEATIVSVSEDKWAASGLQSRDLPPLLNSFFDSVPAIVELLRIVQLP